MEALGFNMQTREEFFLEYLREEKSVVSEEELFDLREAIKEDEHWFTFRSEIYLIYTTEELKENLIGMFIEDAKDFLHRISSMNIFGYDYSEILNAETLAQDRVNCCDFGDYYNVAYKNENYYLLYE